MYMDDDDDENKKYIYIIDTYLSITDFTPYNVEYTLSKLVRDENLTYNDKMSIITEIKKQNLKYKKELTPEGIGDLNKIFQKYSDELNENSTVNTNKNGGKRTRKSVKRKIKKSKRKKSVKRRKRITKKHKIII